ncbi:hypothetical protein [Nocardia sp. R7R-8]|uniref:hypothetical protein n=1 Tax=Nocardia sp. R7R-8 TaxID=3459304 RepID=UPI00403D570D
MSVAPSSPSWLADHHRTLTAQALEAHGWKGALRGIGWGRPDTLGVAAMPAAAALIPLSRKPPVDRTPMPSQDCPMA